MYAKLKVSKNLFFAILVITEGEEKREIEISTQAALYLLSLCSILETKGNHIYGTLIEVPKIARVELPNIIGTETMGILKDDIYQEILKIFDSFQGFFISEN